MLLKLSLATKKEGGVFTSPSSFHTDRNQLGNDYSPLQKLRS